MEHMNKTDAYTKTILTVIAACLIALVFRDIPITSTAHAQSSGGVVPVDIVAINGSPFRVGQVDYLRPALPVK